MIFFEHFTTHIELILLKNITIMSLTDAFFYITFHKHHEHTFARLPNSGLSFGVFFFLDFFISQIYKQYAGFLMMDEDGTAFT